MQKGLLRGIKGRSSQSELGMGVSEDGESNESSFEAIRVCNEWLEHRAHNLFKANLVEVHKVLLGNSDLNPD